MCMLDDVAGCSEWSNFCQEEVSSVDTACTGRGRNPSICKFPALEPSV